jgi:hypothetical protein
MRQVLVNQTLMSILSMSQNENESNTDQSYLSEYIVGTWNQYYLNDPENEKLMWTDFKEDFTCTGGQYKDGQKYEQGASSATYFIRNNEVHVCGTLLEQDYENIWIFDPVELILSRTISYSGITITAVYYKQ